MWTNDDMKYFESANWGDKVLKDEDGEGGWGWELVHCELNTETYTDAKDLVKKVFDDVQSGEFTVEDIYNKYTIHGY